MNNAPRSSVDHLLPTVEAPKALAAGSGIVQETRGNARDVLNDAIDIAEHPDTRVLIRALEVPAVLDNRTLTTIDRVGRGLGVPVALGALLPGCDASTVVSVICGLLTLMVLGGGAFFATSLRLGKVSPKAWKLMKRDGVGGSLGMGSEYNVHSGKPFWYSTWFRAEEIELLKITGNFPDQRKELDIAKGKLGGDPSKADLDALMKNATKLGFAPGFDAYAQAVEINTAPIFFTWSINTDIVDPAKYYVKFDSTQDYALQSRKLNDEISPIVAGVIGGKKFATMDAATKARNDIAKEINEHPALKAFQDVYGLKLVVKLGDIASPDELQQAATRKLVAIKNLETDAIETDRAKQQALTAKEVAEGKANAIEIVGKKENELFEARVKAASGASHQLIGAVGLGAAELKGVLGDLVGFGVSKKGGGSDSGSGK